MFSVINECCQKSSMLQQLVTSSIDIMQSIGLSVKAILTQHHISYNEKDILVIYDPPNFIKNVRKILKRMRHAFLVFFFFTDDGSTSWEVLKDFYHKDKEFHVRMAPKLKEKHITLPPFSYLKVSLAVQVISKSVSNGTAFFFVSLDFFHKHTLQHHSSYRGLIAFSMFSTQMECFQKPILETPPICPLHTLHFYKKVSFG